jgi:hypothetical protein
MAALLWKVNLPAGRVSAVTDQGAYLIEADETRRYWTVEFTDFPSDTALRLIPPGPKGRFVSWDAACAACVKHAEACAQAAVLLRA